MPFAVRRQPIVMSSGITPSPYAQTEATTDYAGADELWANEKYLKRYNADVVRMLSQHLKGASAVLEFGAGIGTLATLWHSTTKVRPECLEIDRTLRQTLVERGFHCYETIESIQKTFDGIYTSNVLEHVGDDVAALKQLHSKLRPGSSIAIFVPAFTCLYSEFDSSIGHYRRYGKRELLNKLKLAQFEVLTCHFVDSIGFFAWLSLKLRRHQAEQRLGSGRSLRIYDKYIYPISKILDALGLKHVLGKNLLVVAMKVS